MVGNIEDTAGAGATNMLQVCIVCIVHIDVAAKDILLLGVWSSGVRLHPLVFRIPGNVVFTIALHDELPKAL